MIFTVVGQQVQSFAKIPAVLSAGESVDIHVQLDGNGVSTAMGGPDGDWTTDMTIGVFVVEEDGSSHATGVYRNKVSWGDDYTVESPANDAVAVKFFDQDFTFTISPDAEIDFEEAGGAGAILTPEITNILETQRLDKETQDWVILMLARLFFAVGEVDKRQVILFIKGVAGSGKSTLAQLIRLLYPEEMVSTLSSNIEPKFGLSAIYKGLVCVCSEVRRDFNLDQGDWQSAASGEEVQIAVKNKTAFQHKWDTSMFFLGNEMPDYRNNSESVSRRMLMVEFNVKVRASDPNLLSKMEKNIDKFMRKGVSMYLKKAREKGDTDIWAPGMVSSQLTGFKNNCRKGIDALYDFVSSSDNNFILGTEHQMPFGTFKSMYVTMRKNNGMPAISFNADHYQSVFGEFNLSVEHPQGSERILCGIAIGDDSYHDTF